MNIEEATNILWQSARTREAPAATLHKQLTMEDAYRVQLNILARRQAAGEALAGETLAGWKIGLSAVSARQAFGLSAPVFAPLFAERHFPSGNTFKHGDIRKPLIESELCFTIGKRLAGPGVTPAQVSEAVFAVAPAFEVVDMRVKMLEDMPLGVADDVAQWGYVTGAALAPYPTTLDLGAITVEMKRNGDVVAKVVGKDVIDNQLESIAWLANHLATYGLALEPGQRIMSGSFTKPTPISKGDRWESLFSSVGAVSATFA